MRHQLILAVGLLLSSCLPLEAQTLTAQVFLAQARPEPTTMLAWALPIHSPPKVSLARRLQRKPVAQFTVLVTPAYEPDYSLESRWLIEAIRTPFVTESRLVVVQFWRGHLELDGMQGTLHMQNPRFGPRGSVGPPPGHDQAGLASSFDLDGIGVVFRFGRDARTGHQPQLWRYLASIMEGSGG
jgi:hypothetical protein